MNFFENTQNCFAYISATKYHSEAVLYSKRTAGYPLSPHIKIIAEQPKLYFEHFGEEKKLRACGVPLRRRIKVEL